MMPNEFARIFGVGGFPTAPNPRPDALALLINLILPETQRRMGPLSLDPVSLVLGAPLEQLLASVMRGPRQARVYKNGAAVQVYPLAIPPGKGIEVRLGPYGEVGFFNDGGMFRLSVPASLGNVVHSRLLNHLSRPVELGYSPASGAHLALFWLNLTPTTRLAIPLGTLGEVGIEADQA